MKSVIPAQNATDRLPVTKRQRITKEETMPDESCTLNEEEVVQTSSDLKSEPKKEKKEYVKRIL